MNRALPFILLPAAVALFPGCNDDATGPAQAIGTASVEVTGAVSRSFSGVATFTVEQGAGFGIAIWGEEDGLSVIAAGAGRLAAGSYAIGDEEADTYGIAILGEDMYWSEGGQMEITASSSDAVVGSASFDARRVAEQGTGLITVTVTFNAMCMPTGGGCN